MKKTKCLLTKTFFILFILFINHQLSATHITGGQLELKHETGDQFTLRLINYFDAFYGNPGAEDDTVSLYIYGKSDNKFMGKYRLPKINVSYLPLSNPLCAIEQLQTKRIVYQLNAVSLPSNTFNDPNGYYLIWARCCRNMDIVNISESWKEGTLFYLEFPTPSLMNNSPEFKPPLNDFLCVGKAFSADFSASDPDGDSLSYSLAIPLAGFSTPNIPAPVTSQPAPYPEVSLVAGFNIDNLIPGTSPLSIDPISGELSVTPDSAGLYSFAVKCEEFRDGTKIGETTREFQVLVIECAEKNNQYPFQITGTSLSNDDNFDFGDTIDYKFNEFPCINIQILDSSDDARIYTQVNTLNAAENIFETNPVIAEINDGEDTVSVNLCLVDTSLISPSPSGFFEIQVILYGAQCPTPFTDTAYFYVKSNATITDLEYNDYSSLTNLAPNPTKENLSVQFPWAKSGQKSVRVISLLGELVYITETFGNEVSLKLNALPQGTYILQIEAAEAKVSKLFIKE